MMPARNADARTRYLPASCPSPQRHWLHHRRWRRLCLLGGEAANEGSRKAQGEVSSRSLRQHEGVAACPAQRPLNVSTFEHSPDVNEICVLKTLRVLQRTDSYQGLAAARQGV
eukprot:5456556-Pleurochrysis_carterae.AAC.1